MNRIILLGNGYDLSCGLKTRYEDFLVFLLKEVIIQKPATSSYQKHTTDYSESFLIVGKKPESAEEVLTKYLKLSDFTKNPNFHLVGISKGSGKDASFVIDLRYSILNNLLLDKNWTDIETSYFNTIISDKKNISKYNIQFNILKDYLKIYIEKENIRLENKFLSINPFKDSAKLTLIERIFSTIHPEQHFITKNDLNTTLKRVFFLCFNYTSFYKTQVKYFLKQNPEINPNDVYFINIHGSFKGEIIFGYGNDENIEYSKLEELENNEHFKHIKSFYYSFNYNYRNFLRAIENSDFEVFSIGHSLGLSDKILLKGIFSHVNCKSIRLFTFGNSIEDKKNNFFESVISLSRHFNDKADFRLKLNPYDPKDVVEMDPKVESQ